MLRTLPIGVYALVLIALVAGNTYVCHEIFAPKALEATTLAVGKGDATLVKTQSGAVILVDTGGDASVLRALGVALPPWKRSIDLLVLTGTKSNAAGGLLSVESRYKVLHRMTIAQSTRLTLNSGSSIDIVVSPNATTTVSITQ